MKKTVLNLLFFSLIFICTGFNEPCFHDPIFQSEVWIAPTEANKIKNPFAGDVKSIDAGKVLYETYCVACHGEKGKGDGPASLSIKTKPADHTSGKMQKQSDGSVFWKLTEGRPSMDMISYKLVLSDNERWFLVNYIRTLSVK